MEENYTMVTDVIDSIESAKQVKTCDNLIKNFRNLHKQKGHDLSFALLGYLQATIKYKGL